MAALARVGRMFTTCPYDRLQYWSGVTYSVGSAIFVAESALLFLPLVIHGMEIPPLVEQYAPPLLFFFGALFCFEVGAFADYMDCINNSSSIDKNDPENLIFAKKNKLTVTIRTIRSNSNASNHGDTIHERRTKRWRLLPSWHRHMGDMTCIANIFQLLGTTLFVGNGVSYLWYSVNPFPLFQVNLLIWTPEIIASCCFITAAAILTVKAQQKWYKPEWSISAWWSGFWAFWGSVGFLVCGIFGPGWLQGSNVAAQISAGGTLLGSISYLLSGLTAWYGAVNQGE